MIFDGVKVGDRFKPFPTKQLPDGSFRIGAPGGVITVTELTQRGFKYNVAEPYHALPARMGPSLVTCGELFCKDANLLLDEYWDNTYEKIL